MKYTKILKIILCKDEEEIQGQQFKRTYFPSQLKDVFCLVESVLCGMCQTHQLP